MGEDSGTDELVAALRRDPQRAFPALVQGYQQRLHGFASRMCRSPEDARDVLQETFLAAFRGIGDYRGEGKLSSWLFRIAANACRKMRRRGKFAPERELSLEEFMPGPEDLTREASVVGGDPASHALAGEVRQAIEDGIAALPGPYRVVLVLRDVEGFPAEEVAEILDLSVPAVKSRLHRARLFLRERLAAHQPAVNRSAAPRITTRGGDGGGATA